MEITPVLFRMDSVTSIGTAAVIPTPRRLELLLLDFLTIAARSSQRPALGSSRLRLTNWVIQPTRQPLVFLVPCASSQRREAPLRMFRSLSPEATGWNPPPST